MAFFGKYALAAMGLAVVAGSTSAQAQSADWKDRVSVGGDFKFRMQRFINGAATGTTDDWSNVIRGRLMITGKVNDSVSVVTRLATGAVNSLNSNRSNTQTLGASSSPFGAQKSFDLNLMYFDWKVMDGTNLMLGKSANGFWTAGGNDMVFAADNTWEGAQAKWMGDMGALKPYANFVYSQLLDRVNTSPAAVSATVGPDVNFTGLQVGTKYDMGMANVNVAVASYNLNNIKGLPTAAVGTSIFGNTADGANFKYEYKLMDANLEVGFNVGALPMAVYTEYVQNSDPSDENKGGLAGFRVGGLKDPGSWIVNYNYRDVRRDSTFAAMTSPAFLAGAGTGTDIIANQVVLGYQFAQNMNVTAIWNVGRYNVASAGGTNFECWYFDLNGAF